MVAIRNSSYKNNKITDLTGWIGKVKKKLQRQKHRNLRLEVILSNTLTMAQHELRQKQIECKMKWINMKKKMADNISGNVVDDDDDDDDVVVILDNTRPEIKFNNDTMDCEDILNLDKFMLQLKTITKPVIR